MFNMFLLQRKINLRGNCPYNYQLIYNDLWAHSLSKWIHIWSLVLVDDNASAPNGDAAGSGQLGKSKSLTRYKSDRFLSA